jgi:hypothetical protein
MSGTPLLPVAAPTGLTPGASAGPIASADTDLFPGWAEAGVLLPADLSVMSIRKLRVLCNQLYRALDSDFPPYGAQEDYAAVAKELEQRQALARPRPSAR